MHLSLTSHSLHSSSVTCGRHGHWPVTMSHSPIVAFVPKWLQTQLEFKTHFSCIFVNAFTVDIGALWHCRTSLQHSSRTGRRRCCTGISYTCHQLDRMTRAHCSRCCRCTRNARIDHLNEQLVLVFEEVPFPIQRTDFFRIAPEVDGALVAAIAYVAFTAVADHLVDILPVDIARVSMLLSC